MKTIFEFLKPEFVLDRKNSMLDVIGNDFPLELIETDPRTALITLALMFSNNDAARCDQAGLAATQLAIYAASPYANITPCAYDELTTRVESHREYFQQLDVSEKGKGYNRMVLFLSFILDEANKNESSTVLEAAWDQADGFRS